MHKGILPILCLVLLPCSSPAAIYLKIGDIKGESTDRAHKDWIDLLSYDIGVEALTSDTTSRRQHTPLTITKPIDKATPLLMTSLASGSPIEGDILLEHVSGDGPPRSLFRLRNAYVGSIHVDGDPDRPIVTGRIHYSYAEWHVQEINAVGTVVERAATYFDMNTLEAGEITTIPRILQAGNVEVASGDSIDVDITITDEDTPSDQLTVEIESDNPATEIGPVRWMAPETLRITLNTRPTHAGQSTVRVSVSDASDTTTMAFSVYADDTGTPWGGYIDAYFSGEEQLDPAIAGPIADPDGDQLSTLMEFLFGTNPREYTPPEEQLTRTLRHSAPAGGGDPVPVLGIEFLRRIDEPSITLSLYGSPDGENWTLLRSGSPLYQESNESSTNPLYESVSGNVTPPGGTTAYFIRFVGSM